MSFFRLADPEPANGRRAVILAPLLERRTALTRQHFHLEEDVERFCDPVQVTATPHGYQQFFKIVQEVTDQGDAVISCFNAAGEKVLRLTTTTGDDGQPVLLNSIGGRHETFRPCDTLPCRVEGSYAWNFMLQPARRAAADGAPAADIMLILASPYFASEKLSDGLHHLAWMSGVIVVVSQEERVLAAVTGRAPCPARLDAFHAYVTDSRRQIAFAGSLPAMMLQWAGLRPSSGTTPAEAAAMVPILVAELSRLRQEIARCRT